jgi:hypothetical protein
MFRSILAKGGENPTKAFYPSSDSYFGLPNCPFVLKKSGFNYQKHLLLWGMSDRKQLWVTRPESLDSRLSKFIVDEKTGIFRFFQRKNDGI